MSMTCSVAEIALTGPKSAQIEPRQLAAFRVFARAEMISLGTALIEPAGQGGVTDDFEARVCPSALAAIATVFDMDADVIAVIEEAQFFRRLVRFKCYSRDGKLRIWVSARPDRAFELRVAHSKACASRPLTEEDIL